MLFQFFQLTLYLLMTTQSYSMEMLVWEKTCKNKTKLSFSEEFYANHNGFRVKIDDALDITKTYTIERHVKTNDASYFKKEGHITPNNFPAAHTCLMKLFPTKKNFIMLTLTSRVSPPEVSSLHALRNNENHIIDTLSDQTTLHHVFETKNDLYMLIEENKKLFLTALKAKKKMAFDNISKDHENLLKKAKWLEECSYGKNKGILGFNFFTQEDRIFTHYRSVGLK